MDSEQELTIRSRHKFHRPAVVEDYVPRGDLERQLLESGPNPILVVAAPAGYGKSSLVSNWIDQHAIPHTWVSLDAGDSDLRVFLETLAAGLGNLHPVAAERLAGICEAPELPPPELLAGILSADIDETAGLSVLVLDDYQVIRGNEIHEFIDALLACRPQGLHVAIIGRKTPVLTLGRLRSQGLVTDVRLGDLRFDEQAQGSLVSAVTGVELSPNQQKKLHTVTEGWPVGLRLFLLARPEGRDLASYLETFDGSLWQVQDYLTEEVLGALPADISEVILSTSILRRICPGLCHALLQETEGVVASGQDVVDTIEENNLFYIPLNDNGQWFRYHHQFQDLLLDLLQKQRSSHDIRILHKKAATWYQNNNYPEDAVYHFLQAGDEAAAGEVVKRYGAALKESQQWTRLDQVLAMLSRETIESSADLIMMLACTSDKAGRISQMIDLVERAEEVHRQQGTRDAAYETALAHISAIRSSIELHFGKTDIALESASFALDVLPDEHSHDRNVALYVQAYAKQTQGHGAEGYERLLGALESASSDIQKSQILFGQCFLDWASGDLEALSRDAGSLRALGKGGALNETFLWGSWYVGGARYLQNDLDAAEEVIGDACSDPWPVHIASYAFCTHIQALIHAARGELETGREVLSALAAKMVSTRSTSYLPDTQAVQAELALRANDYAAALNWALSVPSDSPVLGWGFVSPGLKAARILTVAGSAPELRKADELLQLHEEFYASIHNVRYLIETLALRSLHRAKIGEGDSALLYMSRAVELAQSSRMSRIFIDLGPEIVPVLSRLDTSEQALSFIGKILSAFDREQVADLPGSLSKREHEVLILLSRRLSNKEIGERLYISPATVKRHAHNIYEKLRVKDRHEAVAKAGGLGLLP